VLRGDHVLWVNDKAEGTGHYTLHRLSTGEYRKIASPAGVNYVGNNEFDFSVSGVVADVWFWGQTGGEGTTSQFDIFRWRSETGMSTRITTGASRHIYAQVDGTRVAWQQSTIGGSSDGTFALTATALSTVAPSTLASKATSFLLRDGVLAWMEAPTTTSKALKASTDGTTRTISSLSSATLLANRGGRVAYTEAGKTYSWASSTGQTALRLETAPRELFIAGSAMVFTLGPSVYRVGLD
jgi:hypothetical protein